MKNEFLRHTLATIKYRFDKSVKYRDSEFSGFSLGQGSRTPSEIVNHMYAVLSATTFFIQEEKLLKEKPEKMDLDAEINRFVLGIENLDKIFAKKDLDLNYSKRLLQGPLSDILTHIGQIAMLSRLNDKPIEWEDFSSSSLKPEPKEI